MYLYDLLDVVANRLVNHNNTVDIVSVISRLYRYHMMNRLNITDISNRCKIIIDNNKLSKKEIISIDKKIMGIKLANISYVDVYKNKHKIELLIGDVLSLDTIRKNNIYCLRALTFNIDEVKNIFSNSEIFDELKGKETIIHIIDLVQNQI
jgi:hypothetical protein